MCNRGEVMEATGTPALGANLRPLPGLPASEDPLVRQGIRCAHRRVRVQSHRPHTRFHPRGGALGRDGGSPDRRPDSGENDSPTGDGGVLGESPRGGGGREARKPRSGGGSCRRLATVCGAGRLLGDGSPRVGGPLLVGIVCSYLHGDGLLAVAQRSRSDVAGLVSRPRTGSSVRGSDGWLRRVGGSAAVRAVMMRRGSDTRIVRDRSAVLPKGRVGASDRLG